MMFVSQGKCALKVACINHSVPWSWVCLEEKKSRLTLNCPNISYVMQLSSELVYLKLKFIMLNLIFKLKLQLNYEMWLMHVH
jgi:hypothetical protein